MVIRNYRNCIAGSQENHQLNRVFFRRRTVPPLRTAEIANHFGSVTVRSAPVEIEVEAAK
jgi:hypothetical protein